MIITHNNIFSILYTWTKRVKLFSYPLNESRGSQEAGKIFQHTI